MKDLNNDSLGIKEFSCGWNDKILGPVGTWVVALTELLEDFLFNQAYIIHMALKNQIDFGAFGVFMKAADSRVGTLGGAPDFIDGAIQRFKFTGAYQVNVAVFFFNVVGHAFHDAASLPLLDGNGDGFLLIVWYYVCHSLYRILYKE